MACRVTFFFSATSDCKILRHPNLCEETVDIRNGFTDIWLADTLGPFRRVFCGWVHMHLQLAFYP